MSASVCVARLYEYVTSRLRPKFWKTNANALPATVALRSESETTLAYGLGVQPWPLEATSGSCPSKAGAIHASCRYMAPSLTFPQRQACSSAGAQPFKREFFKPGSEASDLGGEGGGSAGKPQLSSRRNRHVRTHEDHMCKNCVRFVSEMLRSGHSLCWTYAIDTFSIICEGCGAGLYNLTYPIQTYFVAFTRCETLVTGQLPTSHLCHSANHLCI